MIHNPAPSSGRTAASIVAVCELPEDGRSHPFQIEAAGLQQTRDGGPLVADQAENEVLRPDVVVTETEGFAQRKLERLLRFLRERDVSAHA